MTKKKVKKVLVFLRFFIGSILAGITCHYICKWLDRNK